jgi:Domain of unknown function (DUF4407)
VASGWRAITGASGRGMAWGRRLRVLAGVDEAVLDQVPGERARYTALGGVVLGTATIAAFSMWAALGQVLGRGSPWTLLPVAVWGLFVLNLDRWLVSSSTVASGRSWVVPRILVAVVFGIIIAEPLVLRAFASAVEEHVGADRQRALVAYESGLRACNPAPGTAPPAGMDCGALHLTVTAPSAEGAEEAMAGLVVERGELKGQIERDSASIAQLNELARRECNGTDGQGLSGRSGVGPNCQRLRREADEFAAQAGLGESKARLRQVNAEIQRLTGQAGRATVDQERALSAAIVAKVAERRATQGDIGLLERFAALDKLTSENAFLKGSRWLLTLFFIVVDCLPVIVKLLSGQTAYERLVTGRLAAATAREAEEAALAAHERRALLDARRHALDTQVALERTRIDQDAAVTAARMASELEARLGAELQGTITTLDRERPPLGPIDLREGARHGAERPGGSAA